MLPKEQVEERLRREIAALTDAVEAVRRTSDELLVREASRPLPLSDHPYTIEDASLVLNVSVATVRRLVARGELRCTRVGTSPRLLASDIGEYLEQRREDAPG